MRRSINAIPSRFLRSANFVGESFGLYAERWLSAVSIARTMPLSRSVILSFAPFVTILHVDEALQLGYEPALPDERHGHLAGHV